MALSLTRAAPAQTPVVFVNGFQNACTSTSSAALTFGQLPQLLSDRPVLFFDACPYQTQSLEALGQFFGQFIAANLQVDVIAYSLGGLIVRAYLAGKQPGGGFTPPAQTRVRKLILIGSPNFGALTGIGSGAQLSSSTPGSQFLYDLAIWNQGVDDLRETEAIAIVGSGGSLSEPSDGVVALSSASLTFARPDQYTRILPACHSQGVHCAAALQLALVDSPAHPTWLIVQSFLSGTTDWQAVGHAPSTDPTLSVNGGLLLSFKDGSDNFFTDVSQMYWGTQQTQLSHNVPTLFFADNLNQGAGTLHIEQRGTDITVPMTVKAGGYQTFPVKYPPLISRVLPAAGAVNTLSLAAGSIISVYGAGLASSTAHAGTQPLPPQLGNTMLTANGQPLGLFYVSATQINAYLPPTLSGLIQITVLNTSGGQHTTQVLIAPAVPAIFSQDSSGTGLAAALHAATNQPVTSANPAVAGEFISLFLTGLGATYASGGLDYTVATPLLFLSPLSTPAAVSFSGLAPGFLGLNQVNFQVPAGLPSGNVQMYVVSGNYTSNVVLLPVT